MDMSFGQIIIFFFYLLLSLTIEVNSVCVLWLLFLTAHSGEKN